MLAVQLERSRHARLTWLESLSRQMSTRGRHHATKHTIDNQEQYSRRPNMRIHEVPEHDNEDTTTIVMGVINSKMSFKPPLEPSQLEGSHRVGPKLDQQDRVRSGPIIVRFKSDNKRDAVLKAGFRLKEHLARECRATLARECRVLKRTGKLNDCWTTSGNVMVKDNQNTIRQIRSAADIQDIK